MTYHLTLGLLEQAPDRQTAELLLVSALHEGVDGDQLRRAWASWERRHTTPPKGTAL